MRYWTAAALATVIVGCGRGTEATRPDLSGTYVTDRANISSITFKDGRRVTITSAGKAMHGTYDLVEDRLYILLGSGDARGVTVSFTVAQDSRDSFKLSPRDGMSSLDGNRDITFRKATQSEAEVIAKMPDAPGFQSDAKQADAKQAAPSDPQSRCLKNLKQLGTAMMLYASDYDDHLPRSEAWIDTLMPYVQSQDSFRCPALTSTDKDAWGYAFAKALGGASLPRIADPAREVLIYETGQTQKSAVGDPASDPKPNRHGGANVYVYADAHTKAVKN